MPNVLVVNPNKISARTVPELIAYLKASPDKVSFGSAGVGTSQHLAGELFQQMTGTKMVHVPYKGSSQMLTDLLSGQIDLAFDNVPLLLPQVKTGQLAMLATATPKPIIEKLSAEIRAYMQHPETVQKMAELGATAVAVDSEPFAAYIASETERWKKVIEAANIKME